MRSLLYTATMMAMFVVAGVVWYGGEPPSEQLWSEVNRHQTIIEVWNSGRSLGIAKTANIIRLLEIREGRCFIKRPPEDCTDTEWMALWTMVSP